jgi:hypothetical protein
MIGDVSVHNDIVNISSEKKMGKRVTNKMKGNICWDLSRLICLASDTDNDNSY